LYGYRRVIADATLNLEEVVLLGNLLSCLRYQQTAVIDLALTAKVIGTSRTGN
jgi:hypothetical protein